MYSETGTLGDDDGTVPAFQLPSAVARWAVPQGIGGGGQRGGASLPLFKQSAERRPLGADAPHSSVLTPGGEEEEEDEERFF